MACAALCWGLIGVWGRQAQNDGVGPMEIGFWRALIAGGMFLCHALLTGAKFPRGRDLAVIAGFGLVGVSFFYSCYQLAVKLGGTSLASVLQYSAPVFVAVLGWALLRERLNQRDVVCIGVCIAGVMLISLGGGEGVRVTFASMAVGLIAGFSYSLYYVFGRRFFPHYEPVAVFAIMMPVGALGLAPFVSQHPTTTSGWLNVVGLALVCTYTAYLLHSFGLRHMPAARASVIAASEPVSAAVLAAILFGERLSILAMAGALVVIGAAVILGRASSAKTAQAEAETDPVPR